MGRGTGEAGEGWSSRGVRVQLSAGGPFPRLCAHRLRLSPRFQTWFAHVLAGSRGKRAPDSAIVPGGHAQTAQRGGRREPAYIPGPFVGSPFLALLPCRDGWLIAPPMLWILSWAREGTLRVRERR